jgi:hypothetical protein
MRKVIITRSSYLVDELSRQRIVKKHWSLPRGYTLFCIEDPVFSDSAHIYAPSPSRASAILEEAMLFVPFCNGVRSLADIKALHIAGQAGSYHLVSASRTTLPWPTLKTSQNWDTSQTILVVCRLEAGSSQRRLLLKTIFSEWEVCMQRLRQVRQVVEVAAGSGRYAARAHFARASGEATMALLMLLCETSSLTSLKSVELLVPGDNRK